MRVQVLDVVAGEDGIDRARSHGRHVGHGAGHIWRDRGVDVQTDFLPLVRVEATGGLGLALGAAADMEEFHGVLSKGMEVHLEKTPPPFEGRGLVC